jgi:hypothetical protein
VEQRFHKEEKMIAKHHTKLVHEGNYIAEVDVEIMDTGKGWSPYLSLEDAKKLDEVREALQKGDLKKAAKSARVYRLDPVSV